MQQSGFPIKCWNWVCMYACIAITVTRKALKLPNAVTTFGDSLTLFDEKHKRTSWEVGHGGEAFTGTMEPFSGKNKGMAKKALTT